MRKKINLYKLESNLKFNCDNFTRNTHINKLDCFNTYADQLEYVKLFSDHISLNSFKRL